MVYDREEEEKRRGEFAGLSQSLPSLVAATGPAYGSVIHSYQLLFAAYFLALFSIPWHMLHYCSS